MNSARKVVLLSGIDPPQDTEDDMKFRLVYDGPLQARQRDPQGGQRDPMASHVHSIRRVFHGQLKRLWDTRPPLNSSKMTIRDIPGHADLPEDIVQAGTDPQKRFHFRELVANLYRENNYRFAPLVREVYGHYCDLDILFLRRDGPGSVIQAGDIDNRIKTMIDALRKPHNGLELAGNETPAVGEDPFFVLLEDDNLVTSLSVETDTLLDPNQEHDSDQRRVHLVISVTIRPYKPMWFNLSFL
jgi:hypothetical protein